MFQVQMPQDRRKSVQQEFEQEGVFLNIPYAAQFSEIFLAYIRGISAFGLLPRMTLEIPGGERRLDRILSLIETCRYSFHDLSWVALDSAEPATPRFNMPFELGLSVAHTIRRSANHEFFLFEEVPWRLQKSLSDLNGTDPYIHDGTADGVFREIAKAFVREKRQPTVAQMRDLLVRLSSRLATILRDAAASDPFNARAFRDIVLFLNAMVQG